MRFENLINQIAPIVPLPLLINIGYYGRGFLRAKSGSYWRQRCNQSLAFKEHSAKSQLMEALGEKK